MPVNNIGRVHSTEFPTTPTSTPEAPAAPTLPDPLAQLAMGDDMIAQITAMLAKSFREDRKDAKKIQRAQEKLEVAETAKRVADLHAKADAVRNEALVTGLTGLAAATLQVAGSAAALNSAVNASSAASGTTGACQQTASQTTTSDMELAKGSAFNGLGSGAGQGITSIGTLAASTYKTEQVERDASAIAHEGEAGRAKGRAQEAADEAADNRQLLSKVAEFLKAVREGQNASQNAALRKA
jgi:hypothetical protein